jgi:hypothetical protein
MIMEVAMRELFWGYYRPDEEWFKAVWKECIFVFDTNVLLNLYRYKKSTQSTLFTILDKIKDRIYLPYQAAFEYQENRLGVIATQEKAYDVIHDIVNDHFTKLKEDLNNFRRHPIIDISQLISDIDKAMTHVKDDIKQKQKEHPENQMFDDEIQERISDLFEGKVGKPLEVKGEIKKHLEERYNNQVPPGYKDAGKENGNKFGDAILWLEVITKAKEMNKPIILITDDAKDDWWWKQKGKTFGPRPELVQEMKKEANVKFYMYQTENFIKYAEKFLEPEGEMHTEEAIEEIISIKQQDEDNENRVMNTVISANKYLNINPNGKTNVNNDILQKALANIYSANSLSDELKFNGMFPSNPEKLLQWRINPEYTDAINVKKSSIDIEQLLKNPIKMDLDGTSIKLDESSIWTTILQKQPAINIRQPSLEENSKKDDENDE